MTGGTKRRQRRTSRNWRRIGRSGQAKGRNFTEVDNGKAIATDQQLAIDVACWFWKKNGLNALADHDDVRAVTRRINGGDNGLADRQDFLARSTFLLVPVT